MKKLPASKTMAIAAVAIIAGGYAAQGIVLKLSERSFCARVNRFVVGAGGDEIVSLIEDGRRVARGYRVEALIHPPFYWSAGVERRRERLVIGERYRFRAAGARFAFPRLLPVLIADMPAGDECPSPAAPAAPERTNL